LELTAAALRKLEIEAKDGHRLWRCGPAAKIEATEPGLVLFLSYLKIIFID
jgi:hypothetical protein